MLNFTAQNALVTGATGGIGETIAKSLHQAGLTVVISGTREEKLASLAEEMGNDRVHIAPCNLSDREQTKNLIKLAEEKANGVIDTVICNAGVTKDNISMRMSDEEWDDVININLSSSFQIIKSSLRGMMKKKFGRIITIGSIVGTTGNPGQANYAASKAGLAGMTKSIAAEVASRGITANCIAPGFIKTAMTDKLTEDQKQKMLVNIPVGYLGESSDIAGLATFLASDQSRYITGQTLHINGGMLMA